MKLFVWQSEVAVYATRLLMGLEVLGQQVFLQTNTSQRIVLSSENVGKFNVHMSKEQGINNLNGFLEVAWV